MPGLIEHIDAIARKEGRAMLYIEFHTQAFSEWRRYRYGNDPMRIEVLAWLDAQGFTWQACGSFATPDRMFPYLGQVALDVPYDECLPEYRRLRDYLEYPDGTMRHAGIRFCVMPLDYALRNVSHDAPGFWESVGENF